METHRQRVKLSPRESELIKFASEGLTDTAIALRLGISEATVGTYWGRVRIKIGPYNRTELVSIYLRARQEEELEKLRRENEQHLQEVQRASQQSADSHSLFEQIIENAPDAILLVSESGVISTANRAAHELFGFDEAELNGRPVDELIPLRFRDGHGDHRKEYLENPQRRAMGSHLETPALRKGGEEFLIRAALSAITTPTGVLITCAVREVTGEGLP